MLQDFEAQLNTDPSCCDQVKWDYKSHYIWFVFIHSNFTLHTLTLLQMSCAHYQSSNTGVYCVYSKTPHYNPVITAVLNDHLSDISVCNEIGLVHCLAVKVSSLIEPS